MLSVDIKKNLGKFDLDVSFEAERETLALLGASGCGKSMTLKCIAGIETPDEGRIVLNGKVLFDKDKKIDISPRERRVGYLFQQYALFPNMTVLDNIAVAVRDKDKSKRYAVASQKLALMQLEGFGNKRPHQLSGGQQQRVALARILANSPELLLLDEPFSSLDSYLKWQLELELNDIISSYHGTCIFVSHNRDEVYRLCDSVCVLSEGHSETKTTVKKLFEDPVSLSACLLSGCKNFTRIRQLDDTHIDALDWGITLKVTRRINKDAAFAGVRSHHLSQVREPGENIISCGVHSIIEDVFSAVAMLDTPGGSTGYSRLRMETAKAGMKSLSGSEKIYVKIDPEDIMLLHE